MSPEGLGVRRYKSDADEQERNTYKGAGTMKRAVWFDMDGTIANLYGVDGWLEAILREDPEPFRQATGMNLRAVARAINRARQAGVMVGIVTWTPRGAGAEYAEAVAEAKREWLRRHLPSVEWDAVLVVPYGTNKRLAAGGGVLFDDEEPNREAWGAGAYEPREIVRVLRNLAE